MSSWFRRPSLLVRFSVLSLLAFAAFGVVLTTVVGGIVEDRSEDTSERMAEIIARAAITNEVRAVDVATGVPDDVVERVSQVIETEMSDGALERFKLWIGDESDATVVWSNDDSSIGQNVTPRGPLRNALGGVADSKIVGGPNDPHTNGVSSGRLIEAFVPVEMTSGGEPIAGVAEVYLPYEETATKLARDRRTLSLTLGGGLLVLLAVSYQIVARASRRLRRMAARSEHEARHDALTGLPNRTLFLERVGEAVERAQRQGTLEAVMFVDLDRFKDVNDTLGHDVGDQLLIQIAERLGAAVRPTDTVARLGGDEFGLVVANLRTQEDAAEMAATLLERMDEPFHVADLALDVGASIGIALYPDHATDASALLRYADIAMYEAKLERRTYALYAGSDEDDSTDRLQILSELRTGIANDELVLHYQPKVDLRSGEMASVEALVRWNHPRHGMIGPDRFISIAESAGLMRDLTDFVIDRSLRQIRDWSADGLDLAVAVNISARNLNDLGFAARVGELLEQHSMAADRVELELTETALMIDQTRAFSVLNELHTLGVSLAIDDYGTGYSSLAYLKRLPIGVIKMDRSFVADVATNDDNLAIVRSTISMARSLGLQVVAEGVETESVRDELIEQGCVLAQGYLFAHPMPADEILPLLQPPSVLSGRA